MINREYYVATGARREDLAGCYDRLSSAPSVAGVECRQHEGYPGPLLFGDYHSRGQTGALRTMKLFGNLAMLL